MRISVVIPCHDAGPWIGQALDSVAQQTRTPDEVIVVDDGSTDDSLARIEASGVATKIIETRQGGASGARNVGIDAATGQYVAFLDADDYWTPEHLARAEALLAGGSDVFYVCARDTLKPDGVMQRARPRSITEPIRRLDHTDFVRYWYEFEDMMTSSMVMRRDRIEAVGRFDVGLRRAEDLDLCLRMVHGHTFAYDPVATLVYRAARPGSLTADRASTDLDGLLCWVKNLPLYPERRASLEIRARKVVADVLQGQGAPDFWERGQVAFSLLSKRDRLLLGIGRVLPRAFTALNGLRHRVLDRTRAAQREVLGRVLGARGAPRREELVHAILRAAHRRDGLHFRRIGTVAPALIGSLAAEAEASLRGTEGEAGTRAAVIERAAHGPALTRVLESFPGVDDVRVISLEAGARRDAPPRPVILPAAPGEPLGLLLEITIPISVGDDAEIAVDGHVYRIEAGTLQFANLGCTRQVAAGAAPVLVFEFAAPLTKDLARFAFFDDASARPDWLRPAQGGAEPPPLRQESIPPRTASARVVDEVSWWRYLLGSDVAFQDPDPAPGDPERP